MSGNVLIVDDDQSITKLFELVGRKFNVNVIHANDGSEASNKMQNQSFDLVVTDLQMPKMNGVKFIHNTRMIPRYKEFPFVIVSGNLLKFEPEVALLNKVDVYEKPLTIKTITKIFEKKFRPINKVNKLNIQSIFNDLNTDLTNKTKLLLEIITKSKPLTKTETLDKSSVLGLNEFNIYTNLVISNFPFYVHFSFEKNLAVKIASIFEKKSIAEISEQEILSCLNKVSQTLLVKTIENFENQGVKTNFTVIGTNYLKEKDSIFKIDHSIGLERSAFENDVGSLKLYLAYS